MQLQGALHAKHVTHLPGTQRAVHPGDAWVGGRRLPPVSDDGSLLRAGTGEGVVGYPTAGRFGQGGGGSGYSRMQRTDFGGGGCGSA